ncbi:MAG TPA: hypothetical protein VMG40_18625 [Bryobacteraceae bacterium]|nr:hypothetical protein [Bryobacteraceae bacterium]
MIAETALRAIARLESQVRLAGEVLGALSAKMSVTVNVRTPEDLWKPFEQAWSQLTDEQRDLEIVRLTQRAGEDGWRLIEGNQ